MQFNFETKYDAYVCACGIIWDGIHERCVCKRKEFQVFEKTLNRGQLTKWSVWTLETPVNVQGDISEVVIKKLRDLCFNAVFTSDRFLARVYNEQALKLLGEDMEVFQRYKDKKWHEVIPNVQTLDIDTITPETIKQAFIDKGFKVEEGHDQCLGYETVNATKGDISVSGDDYNGDEPWFMALGEYSVMREPIERKKEENEEKPTKSESLS